VTSEVFMHCPRCGAEFRAGSTICSDDGTALVPGPSPEMEEQPDPTPGGIEVVHRHDVPANQEAEDLFAEEERVPARIVLGVLPEEAARELMEALEAEDVGARLGTVGADGQVEVTVHDSNLAVAQAVLVELAGDLTLLQASGEDAGESDDGYVQVATTRAFEAGTQAARLRDAGIPVRIEFPDEDVDGATSGTVTLFVPEDSLEAAREALRITS
jgi:hypothetical protein